MRGDIVREAVVFEFGGCEGDEFVGGTECAGGVGDVGALGHGGEVEG